MISLISIIIAALAAGVGLDYLLGDPPNRYHPVAWLGRLIGWFVPRLKGRSEKTKGAIFTITIVAISGLFVHFLTCTTMTMIGGVAVIIVSALVLKIAIAV